MPDAGDPVRTVRATVIHARADGAYVRELALPAGSSLADAVRASGLLQAQPALAASGFDVGVHGRLRSPDTLLADGDRVEVYRRLTIDPKEARRIRAELRAGRAGSRKSAVGRRDRGGGGAAGGGGADA
jgi:hypothetical protein